MSGHPECPNCMCADLVKALQEAIRHVSFQEYPNKATAEFVAGMRARWAALIAKATGAAP